MSGSDTRNQDESVEFELRAAGVSGGRHELHVRLVRLEFTVRRAPGAESVDVSGLGAAAVESAHLSASTNTNESASSLAFVLETLPTRGVLFLRPRAAGFGDGYGDGDGDRSYRAYRAIRNSNSGSDTRGLPRRLLNTERSSRGSEPVNAASDTQYLVRARSPLGRFTQVDVNDGRLLYRLSAHPSLFLPPLSPAASSRNSSAKHKCKRRARRGSSRVPSAHEGRVQ